MIDFYIDSMSALAVCSSKDIITSRSGVKKKTLFLMLYTQEKEEPVVRKSLASHQSSCSLLSQRVSRLLVLG